jgi:hypothetical protein
MLISWGPSWALVRMKRADGQTETQESGLKMSVYDSSGEWPKPDHSIRYEITERLNYQLGHDLLAVRGSNVERKLRLQSVRHCAGLTLLQAAPSPGRMTMR